MLRILTAILAAGLMAFALVQLLAQTRGLQITRTALDGTPLTVFNLPGAPPAPAVVIAHGFAGSQQLMLPFATTIARAGYVAVTFDALGHAGNPAALTGDVATEDGATTRLLAQLAAVVAYARTLPQADGQIALLGHSMASDIVVREAIADPTIEATIAVSLFSPQVTPDLPRNLLVITGALEPGLTDEALRVAGLASGAPAEPFTTTGDQSDGTARRAVLSPGVEHVGVLYSATSQDEARDWLDLVFDRADPSARSPAAQVVVPPAASVPAGPDLDAPAIVAPDPDALAPGASAPRAGALGAEARAPSTLGGPAPDTSTRDTAAPDAPSPDAAPIVATPTADPNAPTDTDDRAGWLGLWFLGATTLAWSAAPLLPRLAATAPRGDPRWRPFAIALVVPAVATPLVARFAPEGLLPVPVADYLSIHFLIYGLTTALILWRAGWPGLGPVRPARTALALAAFLAFAILAIYLPLDRFVTAFTPQPARLGLLLTLFAGLLPYFLADEALTRAPAAPRAAYLLSKLAFLASLGLAIALDPGRLFFLILILPIMLIFFTLFGLFSAWTHRATGTPLTAALACAALFAWAIAVTFPILGT